MSVVSVTQDEIDSAVNAAAKVANELNKLFADKRVNARMLYMADKIRFTYHPYVAAGKLGQEYKKGTEEWVQNGALEQLFDKLDAKPRFKPGSMGSVWLDVYLTGGEGAYRRVDKQCRVTPTRHPDGSFDLMLDNTFDEVW